MAIDARSFRVEHCVFAATKRFVALGSYRARRTDDLAEHSRYRTKQAPFSIGALRNFFADKIPGTCVCSVTGEENKYVIGDLGRASHTTKFGQINRAD